jgi:Fungal hydrophobin
MRFSTAIILSTVATFAVASPWGGNPTQTVTVTANPTATTVSQCNTGDIQCCDSTTAASSGLGSLLLGLLGIVVQGTDVVLGVSCSPVLFQYLILNLLNSIKFALAQPCWKRKFLHFRTSLLREQQFQRFHLHRRVSYGFLFKELLR